MIKKIILSLVICLLIAPASFAQDASSAPFQQQALKEFPQLGQCGSEFNKRFLDRAKSLRAANDPLMTRADWPLMLAREIAMEVAPNAGAAQAEADKAASDHLASAVTIFGTVSSKVAAGLIINIHIPAKFESSGEDFDGTAVLTGNPKESELAEGDNIGSPSLGVLAYRDGTYEDGVSSLRRYRFIAFRKIGDPADPN